MKRRFLIILFRELSPELSFSHLWSMPFMQKKFSDCILHSPLSAVVACRLRDGYSIRDVNINAKSPKGELVQLFVTSDWFAEWCYRQNNSCNCIVIKLNILQVYIGCGQELAVSCVGCVF